MVTDVDTFPDEIWVGSVRYVRETKREQWLRENDEYPVVIAIEACFCPSITAWPHDRQSSCLPAYTVRTGTSA